MEKNVLPDKPSELLRVAVEDLSWAEDQPNVMINMGIWYAESQEGWCEVCAAGAIMLRRFDADKMDKDGDGELSPNDFPDAKPKFAAINAARIGNWAEFFYFLEYRIMGKDLARLIDELQENRPIDYRHDKEAWYTWMADEINILESYGY